LEKSNCILILELVWAVELKKINLSVPSMPVGSLGMEHNNMFRPYVVYLLKADGSHGKYAKIQTADEQFLTIADVLVNWVEPICLICRNDGPEIPQSVGRKGKIGRSNSWSRRVLVRA